MLSVELLRINGWGFLGLPYRMFKRFMRMFARFLIRINILWLAIKAFEKRTHFFENIGIRLKLIKKPARDVDDDDEEEYGDSYDDGSVEYEESEEESAEYTGDSYTQGDDESSQAEVEDSEVQSEASRIDEDDKHHESEHNAHLTHPMFSHMRFENI